MKKVTSKKGAEMSKQSWFMLPGSEVSPELEAVEGLRTIK